jgi:hypothetical protein
MYLMNGQLRPGPAATVAASHGCRSSSSAMAAADDDWRKHVVVSANNADRKPLNRFSMQPLHYRFKLPVIVKLDVTLRSFGPRLGGPSHRFRAILSLITDPRVYINVTSGFSTVACRPRLIEWTDEASRLSDVPLDVTTHPHLPPKSLRHGGAMTFRGIGRVFIAGSEGG